MLNTENFVLLAGRPDAWDAEIAPRMEAGESLVEIQTDQYERGRRVAQLVRAYFPREGYMVRAAMSLQTGVGEEFITPVNGRYTREEAVRLGAEWAEKDPENREFIAHKLDLA